MPFRHLFASLRPQRWLLPLLCFFVSLAASASSAGLTPQTVLELPPGENNPRNSEGDFIRLKDGRLLFVYTRFTGGSSDHAAADLVSRQSSDHGQTWSKDDQLVVENEADWNVMSVSLLRLLDGRIAMFYLQKNSLTDCRPVVRFSTDEAQSWTPPIKVIPDKDSGYFVLNNDRVVQLRDGRLVAPVAVHSQPGKPQDWAGKVTCYLSDDRGETWKRSETTQSAINPEGRRVNAQEPGVVELRDGRLMMFVRTNAGEQYRCYSSDRGTTWSSLEPMGVASPLSPATIERIPETNTLLMAWNDHSELPVERRKARTPFSLAVSDDEGQTWKTIGELDDDPKGWFCYTAMEFTDRHVLLAHVAGKQSPGKQLATTRITRVPLDQILPAANESSEPKLELVEVRKIWDKASHNAFTDLIRFKNRWYCVFREGENHVSPDGSLRVLTSQDGKQWESAALISSPDSDLRDAKITVTPDGRLMLSGAEAIHEPTTHRHQSLVWFSKHGTQWSDAVEVGDRDNWLWRVSWHDGKAYGFGYGCGPDNRGLRFYRSDDGRSFETLIDRVDVPGTYPNETSIVFAADDTAHCLLRQDGEPKSGFIGKAKPPYQDWTWQSLGVRIGGPEWIRLPNGKCLAAVRLYDDKVRTSLAWIDPETAEFTEALALPSGGDTSYAGMVLHGDEVWISYYSSHDRKNTSAKSAIYLARVKIDPVFETPGRKGTN